jgi:hypothetical protein
LGGEAKTARAFQPAALQIVQRKARHACMVNRTLPRRLCVNPEWLTAARKDLFPACFAPKNAIFGAKHRIFAKNGTR